MRSLVEWLGEYGESHRHPVNKRVHWICVPAIMLSVLGLLWLLPAPLVFNWAIAIAALALLYYFILSPRLALGMLPIVVAMLLLLAVLDGIGAPVLTLSIGVFVLAWIAQFWGHEVEGKRPSFFKDVQFLLIGPLWLLAHVYRRLGIPY